MTIDNKIRDENLQYDTNRVAAKPSTKTHRQVKLIYMNSLQAKKSCHLTKVE